MVPGTSITSSAAGVPTGTTMTLASSSDPRTDSLRLASLRRTDAAAALVDTVVASAETLRVRLGDSVSYREAIGLVFRGRSGEIISDARPMYRIEAPSIAQLRRGYVVGVSTGSTLLLIQPARIEQSATMGRPVTRVRVVVTAR